MKKQSTLDYLVRNLDKWPSKIKGAPLVNGYRWILNTDCTLFLYDNTGTDGDLKITRKDWLLAQVAKESIDYIAFGLPPKAKQKIYISGPITGYENTYQQTFADAVKGLSDDYIVLSPAALPAGLSQKDYMSICLPMVACCDAIYMLENWDESKGALAELSYAEKLGLKVIEE